MDLITSSNYKKIEKIVEECFSLDSNSLERFRKNLYDPDIDEGYKKIIDEKDFRLKVALTKEDLEFFDEGWKNFKSIFRAFIKTLNVTYYDFINGVILIGKESTKISRALVEFYLKNEELFSLEVDLGWSYRKGTFSNEEAEKKYIKGSINSLYREISGYKFSGKVNEFSLVLSLNFADWFLCSTDENWSSCLNLESDFSGAYWTGLPGTIIDKNRALLYLTDGRKKNYLGITTDKIIRRSWVLLDTENNFQIVRFFPSEINFDLITKKFEGNWINMPNIKTKAFSKHQVEFLKFANGDSCFIYQDNTTLKKSKDSENKYHIVSSPGNGGYYCPDKNGNYIRENIFFFTGGLSELLEIKEEVSCYFAENLKTCICCGRRLRSDNLFTYGGDYYCESCYDENICKCSECGRQVQADNLYNINDEQYCYNCFRRSYFECYSCFGFFPIDEATNVYGNRFCNECCEELFKICEVCGALIRRYVNGNPGVCVNCLNKNLQENNISVTMEQNE